MKIKKLSVSSCSGPKICVGLLGVLGLAMLFPVADNTGHAYADGEETGASTRAADSSIALAFDGTPSFTEEAKADEVAYITNTFTVTAKKQAKFTLQMTAMNGSGTNLHGKENTSATIGGVGENVAPANFGDNTWGYALNSNTGATPASLTYSSMPNYGTPKNVITENLTGAESESKTYLLAFAAKIGSDSPADHYIGNFLLSVLGDQFDPATYALTYDGNGGTGVPSSQSCVQTSVGSTCNITVAAGTPSRNGFTFLGWGNNPTDITANPAYSAGNTITMSANKTIYAIWKANDITGLTNMQDMTSSACAATPTGTSVKLKDTRDGKTYYVTKLEDGNCWMTQNLAYGTTSTTSIGTPCTLSGTSCSGWSNSTTAKYFAIGSHSDGNHSSQGNFYNWPAAVAGDTSTTEPKQGICPDKWQLPTSNNTNSKSFGGLANAYSAGNNAAGSKIFRGEPLYFQYGGYVNNATLYNAGSNGYYWSSTPNTSNANRAYNLYLDSSDANPSDNNFRSNGFSVRCVAK